VVSTSRNALRNRLEWLAARLAFVPLSVLPGPVLVFGMTLLSRLACALGVSLRRRTCRLVEARLGLPRGSPEARRVVRGAFDTLLLNAVEPTLLERQLRRGRDIRDFVTVEGAEHLQAAQASGRGVIVVTGHFGAWEAFVIVMHRLFQPVWVITRQLNNPLLERELVERRLKWVAGRLPKEGSGLRLARVLRRGGTAGLLLDQNAGQHGAILRFLGAPASQHTVAGTMARRVGAVVVPAYLLRLPGRLRFHMLVEPAVQVDPALGEEQAVLEVTRRLSDSLERQVRARPEQWMWLHDRWRHAERVLRQQAREPGAGPGRTQAASAEGTNGP
jgi:KDO2-lipid IV(A) lauroyltransferase